MNEKELLEWYIAAGVDVFFENQPSCIVLKQTEEAKDSSVALVRPATTDMAQVSSIACKNARDICDRVQNLQELKAAVEAFDGCSLKLTSNKTIFGSGNPDSKIMIIGEAPNGDEDRMGELFVGKSGQLLDNMLSSIELDRSCCYISNILPWRPPGNRVPTETEVAVCLPFIKKQIELISPNIILILGGSAANNLLDNDLPISKLRGKWMEYKPIKGDKIDVLASFHPDYLLKNPAQKAKIWADLLKLSKKC